MKSIVPRLVLLVAAGMIGWPAAAEVLRVASYGLPKGLGNPYSSTSISEMYVWAAMFDALTSVDGQAKVQPALAVAWGSRDELTWEFELRRGVTFSNGEPFDADAVVAVISYLISPAAASESVAREFTAIASVRAIDSHRVEIGTHYPTAILPAQLAGMRMVAPAQWQRLGPQGFARNPVGTGPFRVKKWGSAQVSLTAFTQSWRPPRLEAIEIYEVLDPSSRLQGIQSGHLHIGLALTPDDLPELERTGAVGYIGPGSGVVGMSFVTVKEGPIQDRRVRQALNLAVDRQSIVEILFGGHTQAANQPAPHYVHGFNPDLAPYPYDPARARALLTEAGYGDGFELIAEVVVGGSASAAPLYSFLVQQLADVGVALEVRNVPVSQLITKAVSGDWDGAAFGMEFDFKPTVDAMRPIPMHSCLRLVPWHCDPGTMPLIEAAQREFDPQRRLELLQEIMRVFHEDPPMLYLYESVHFDGLSVRVRGFNPANRIINYHEIWLADCAGIS